MAVEIGWGYPSKKGKTQTKKDGTKPKKEK